ncbi:hypothetical protein NJ76_06865 [Rhodococcus sp. IITR03]|nr:hypothetical protein NJ76_06865 [Rhodococcus sp. IITR03]
MGTPRFCPTTSGAVPPATSIAVYEDLHPDRRALRAAGIGEVCDDSTTRALYSSDASLYRVPPQAVVRARSIDDIATTLDVCRREGVPLTSRGTGTSLAATPSDPASSSTSRVT